MASATVAAEKINKMIKNKLLIYLWQDVQGVTSMKSSVSLFESRNSYDDLYQKYGVDKVFSDDFINDFLAPALTRILMKEGFYEDDMCARWCSI